MNIALHFAGIGFAISSSIWEDDEACVVSSCLDLAFGAWFLSVLEGRHAAVASAWFSKPLRFRVRVEDLLDPILDSTFQYFQCGICPAKELRFQENEELRLKDAYNPH